MLTILGHKLKIMARNPEINLMPCRSPAREAFISSKERQAYSPLYSEASRSHDEGTGSSSKHVSTDSTYSLYDEDRIGSPPPGYRSPGGVSAYIPHLPRKRPIRRCLWVLLLLLVTCVAYSCVYTTFRPPNYIVLPPERYLDYLNGTLSTQIPAEEIRQAITRHLDQIRYPPPSILESRPRPADASKPWSVVPSDVWSSDGKPAPESWYASWRGVGAEPHFLDDAAAEAWVEKHWQGTEIKRVWDEMPRFILKADLLRYLLLLVEGGTWSDADTVPLMPVSEWAKDVEPLSPSHSIDLGSAFGSMVGSPSSQWRTASAKTSKVGSGKDDGAAQREPIRAIISIEDDPFERQSLRAILERHRLIPMNRHRSLQFVQWTIHMAPNHPILLDVLRRIIQASQIYRANEAEKERDAFADGWGWNERDPEQRTEQTKARESREVRPWDTIRYKWKWQAGAWRWGWDSTSVEEWTGPATWTDAVISYLYASAGVRAEDLVGLKHPVQIRDIVVLPSSGFNPPKTHPRPETRVVHLFRGSWKG